MNKVVKLFSLFLLSFMLVACGEDTSDTGYTVDTSMSDDGSSSMDSVDTSSMSMDMDMDMDMDSLMSMDMDTGAMMEAMMGSSGTGAGENTNPEYRLLGEVNVTIAPQYGDPSGVFYQLASAQSQNADTRISEPTYKMVSDGYLVQLPAYAINPVMDEYYPDYDPEYNYFKFTLPNTLPTMADIMSSQGGMISYPVVYPANYVLNEYYPPEYQVYGFGKVNLMYIDKDSYASVGAIIIGGYILIDVYTNEEMTETKNVFVTFGTMIFKE
jgi:hypothetical protein